MPLVKLLSRLDTVKRKKSKPEDRSVEIIQTKRKKVQGAGWGAVTRTEHPNAHVLTGSQKEMSQKQDKKYFKR